MASEYNNAAVAAVGEAPIDLMCLVTPSMRPVAICEQLAALSSQMRHSAAVWWKHCWLAEAEIESSEKTSRLLLLVADSDFKDAFGAGGKWQYYVVSRNAE